MPASLTFGSFGDIITTIQITQKLCLALSESRGSAKKYQELRQGLARVVEVLFFVIATYQQYEESPWLCGVRDTTKSVVDECAGLIQNALNGWEKYSESLQKGGSGNKLKDTCRKVQWLWEKEEVAALRESLQRNAERLNLLTSIAIKQSIRVDNTTLLHRIEEVRKTMDSHRAQTLSALEAQNETLQALAKSSQRQDETSQTILAKNNSILQSISSIHTVLQKIYHAVVELQYQATNARFFTPPDPTFGKGIVLEDALGNVLNINWDLVHSWDFLDQLLAHQFEGLKGYHMIVRRQYVLEESCSGRDLDRRIPWRTTVRRGMRLSMSMVFMGYDFGSVCPRCSTQTSATAGTNTQCVNKACNMCFRVVESVSDYGCRGPFQDQRRPNSIQEFEGADTSSGIEYLEPSDFHRVRLINDDRLRRATELSPRSALPSEHDYTASTTAGIASLSMSPEVGYTDSSSLWQSAHVGDSLYDEEYYEDDPSKKLRLEYPYLFEDSMNLSPSALFTRPSTYDFSILPSESFAGISNKPPASYYILHNMETYDGPPSLMLELWEREIEWTDFPPDQRISRHVWLNLDRDQQIDIIRTMKHNR